jgi:outer membrane protein assembly factor BamB
VDGTGNLYIVTSNGSLYDGVSNWAESALKLSPSLTLLDWFTPSNWNMLQAQDLDLSSGHVMLIPGTHLLAFGAKDYNVYALDQNCMGHLGNVQSCANQIFLTNPTAPVNLNDGIFGGIFDPQDGYGYFPNNAGAIYRFKFSSGTWNTTPLVSSGTYNFPGAQMAWSSNGLSNGILWGLTGATSAESAPAAGTLRAFTLAYTEIWNSDQTVGDTLGTLAKFSPPTVADGRVYVSTLDNKIQVFGLFGIAPPPVQGGHAVHAVHSKAGN